MCRVGDLEVLNVQAVDVRTLHRCSGISGLLKKVIVDQVRKARVPDILTEGMDVVRIVRNCWNGKRCTEVGMRVLPWVWGKNTSL